MFWTPKREEMCGRRPGESNKHSGFWRVLRETTWKGGPKCLGEDSLPLQMWSALPIDCGQVDYTHHGE